jgi:hypothetical protein
VVRFQLIHKQWCPAVVTTHFAGFSFVYHGQS